MKDRCSFLVTSPTHDCLIAWPPPPSLDIFRDLLREGCLAAAGDCVSACGKTSGS